MGLDVVDLPSGDHSGLIVTISLNIYILAFLKVS